MDNLKNVLTPSVLKKDEVTNLGQPKKSTYGCRICHESGHRYRNCSKILIFGKPLDIKNETLREKLVE